MPLGLQEQPDVFELLFAHHPEPMWIYDLETLRFIEVNNAAVRQYGYSRLEFQAMDIRGIRPPEDLGLLEADLATPRPELQHSGTWRHSRRDGSVIYVEVTSHTLTYADRPAALVVARDVTERVAADGRREQLLRETEAARRELEVQTRNFDVMFEQMADPVLLFDGQARVQRMNEAARAIFTNNTPVPPGTLSSQQLTERFRMRDEHGDPIPIERVPVRRVLRGETLVGGNAVDAQVGPRSRPILLNITGSPIRDPRGEIVGAVMISRDVTERRRLEQQAQAALMELNRRIETFVAMAGHEMRTPITSLLGNIQLAARSLEQVETPDPARAAQVQQWKTLVVRMERQARLLKRLVNDVLDTSAADTGGLQMDRAPFDVFDVVDDVVADATAQMRGRKIDMQIEVERPLGPRGRSRAHWSGAHALSCQRAQVFAARRAHTSSREPRSRGGAVVGN